MDSGIDPNAVPNYLLSVDNPVVVPVGVKVRMLLTAQDVIHAWWVPALAVKKDAIPGFVNEIWFEVTPDKVGTYRGQCAELCGRDHGFMPIVVEAKTPADYAAWVKTQQEAQKQASLPAGNNAG
jgi:cytochrome c oxidase subunit 2